MCMSVLLNCYVAVFYVHSVFLSETWLRALRPACWANTLKICSSEVYWALYSRIENFSFISSSMPKTAPMEY